MKWESISLWLCAKEIELERVVLQQSQIIYVAEFSKQLRSSIGDTTLLSILLVLFCSIFRDKVQQFAAF